MFRERFRADGTTVTLTPSENLTDAQNYSVIITTQIKDRNGFVLAQEFRSVFTTTDRAAPFVTQITPASNSIQIPVNSSVIINTNEAIARDLNLSEAVHLTGNQTEVGGAISLNNTGRIITFVPNGNLSESVIYTMTVNGLRDLAGNVQTQAFTSNFTTIDSTPPTINPLAIGRHEYRCSASDDYCRLSG